MVTSRSPAETVEAGADFGARLLPGTVVALHGDLGAGKTTFVRGIVRALLDPSAVKAVAVTSPSFSLVHTYSDGAIVVHHVDAFRVASEAELDELGFDEYLDGRAIVVVEWPEHVGPRLPVDALHVTLRHVNENGVSGIRHIELPQPHP